MIFMAVVKPAVDDSGTVETFLFSQYGFTTKPTDTPPHKTAEERLLQPANFQRRMTDGRTLFGAIRAGIGACVLQNKDGALDAFSRYSFGLRDFEMWVTESVYPGPFPASWTLVFKATMESCDTTADEVRILLRESSLQFDKKVCTTFAGTGEIEGPTTFAGLPKPWMVGRNFNVEPTFIANGIWMLNSRPKTWANRLRDGGGSYSLAATTGGEDVYNYSYTNWASIAASPGLDPGTYKGWSDASLIRVGNDPAGRWTVDSRCFETAYNPSTDESARLGSILQTIATEAGVADINSSDVTALDALYDDVFGYYLKDLDTTYLQIITALATSGAVYVGFDRTSELRMRAITSPSGTAVWSINPSNASDLARVPSESNELRVPAKKVTVNYAKNWTIQDAAEMFNVTIGVRGEYALEFVRNDVDSNSVDTKHANASELVFDCYTRADRASTGGSLTAPFGVRASDLLDLFGVERDWVTVDCEFSIDLIESVDLCDVVEVAWPRWGYDTPKKFLVVGMWYVLDKRKITLTLWG